MTTKPPLDDLHTVTVIEQLYHGTSSSQLQLAVRSGAATSPGLCIINTNLGQHKFQVAAGGSSSPERRRSGSDDARLRYISQVLMEDTDDDDRASTLQGEAVLQSMEKSFHDVLGQAHPPPATTNCPLSRSNNEPGNTGKCGDDFYYRLSGTSFGNGCLSPPLHRGIYLTARPLISVGRTSTFVFPALHSWRGVEEAKMLASRVDKIVISLKDDMISNSKLGTKAEVGEKNKKTNFEGTGWDILEGRSSKHHAITTCALFRNESFDGVLLCYGMKSFHRTTRLRQIMAEEASKNSLKGPRWKLRGKKKLKKELVDLRTLLVDCAQAVADGNGPLATELLNKIRLNSSSDGDCTQRLAFYLADGLEARLAGIESQVYRSLTVRRTSTTDWLEAYSLYLAACPFNRASYNFANQTILDVSQGQPRVHIIDFGICFGFQWPSLIQRFGQQDNGGPKLRITGIDVPRPGFHPWEMIEDTGKRLADYANMFKVPFWYQGVAASRWETITIEDLNIGEDEVLIINCMFQMKNLGGYGTVAINSARDKVLKTMRRMNPKVFIFGIVNGLHSSPFFIPRFKDVMFHYSGMFDMLDANVPRDNEARKMIEEGLFGQDALNTIACEGAERTERPESYKQWQARCLKAGFQHLPVDPAILKIIVRMNKLLYHEEFFAVEDSGWLLQGWKGRVVYAISTWKPNEICDDQ
uniref:Uncharacterized protein n=1 Tax=Avena sativa TaxID=4498 RepID=A0ACD5W4S6_AVESA